jgi:glucose-1-phosphate adenylyltransferase
VGKNKVLGFEYEGYWADIGTIRSFYDINIALASKNPPFSLIDEGWPIYTHPRNLPASQIECSTIDEALIAEGCWIQGSEIRNSVVGLRSQIRAGTRIERSIIMGADYYGFFQRGREGEGELMLGIGKDCQIEGAILDKNSSIGKETVIKPFPAGINVDDDLYVVRDGIVVIPKSTHLPPGTHIAP